MIVILQYNNIILRTLRKYLQSLSKGIYHHLLQMSLHILLSLPALCGQRDEDICNNTDNMSTDLQNSIAKT
jgi:hypothetical protein